MKANDIIPEFIMLVGIPASGKSTFTKQLLASHPEKNYAVLSTDDLLDDWAEAEGLTYPQAFQKYAGRAEKLFKIHLRQAINNKRNIIIDRTNLTPKSRGKLLRLLPGEYKTKAVVFDVEPNEVARRLDVRAKETGKVIPDNVIANMISSYVPPTKDEFDEIQIVK